MSNLSSKTRNSLPESTFGLPGQRKYPMPDASHAANAKARATQQVKAGNLTSAEKAQIDAKADRILCPTCHGSGHVDKPHATDMVSIRNRLKAQYGVK